MVAGCDWALCDVYVVVSFEVGEDDIGSSTSVSGVECWKVRSDMLYCSVLYESVDLSPFCIGRRVSKDLVVCIDICKHIDWVVHSEE